MLLLLAVLCLAGLAQADESSTLRPAPEGLEMADLAKEFKGYRAPRGFRVEVAAAKLGDAASFAFDDEGRLLVVRPPAGPALLLSPAVAYKDGTKRTVPLLRQRAATAIDEGPLGGELKQKLAVNHAGGILALGKSLLYAANGSLLESGGKGTPKVLVQGLGGERVRLALGAEGWLYIAASEGDHFAEGSDGSRATALRTGAVFRCRPDGSKLHVFAQGFHDPGQPAFDLAGNLFLHDGSVPLEKGFATGRLLHVCDGGDYGYRLAPGAAFDTPDSLRAGWTGEKAGTMGPMVKTAAGPASPLSIYNDASLPEACRGLLLRPDPARRALHVFKAEADGGTFNISQEFDLLAGPEGFRPMQAATGPDGALYVLDAGDGGRLLRLSWAGTKEDAALPLRPLDSWAKVAKLEDADLVNALAGEEASMREAARREVVRRGDKNRAALLKFFAEEKTPLAGRIAALGALQAMADAATLKAFGKALEEGDSEIQVLAASALGLCAKADDKEAHDALLRGLGEAVKAVKRAVAMALARAGMPGAADSIARALSFDDGKEPIYTHGLHVALEALGRPGIEAFLALADSGNQKDIDRVAIAFPSLRSAAAFSALPGMLRNPHLNDAQREAVARSAAAYVLEGGADLDAVAAQVMAEKKETDEVRVALLEALAAPGTKAGPKAAAWALEMLGTKATRDAAIPAVGKLRPAKADTELAALLEKADRKAVMAALGDADLLEKLAAKEPEALLALARIDAARAAPLARKLLGDKSRAALAAEVLGRTTGGAIGTARLVLAGKLDARAEAARALRRHAANDEAAAKLLADLTR